MRIVCIAIILGLLFLSCGEKETTEKKDIVSVKKVEQKKEDVSQSPYTDLDGTQVSLDSYKGKVVLLDFWATWCGPCKVGMPTMQAVSEHFKGKDFAMIGVSVDNNPGVAKKYITSQGFSYTFLFAKNRAEVNKKFQFQGIPALFLLDKEGNIVWKHIGFNAGNPEGEKQNIITEVEKYLNKTT